MEVCQEVTEDHQEAVEDPQAVEGLQVTEDHQTGGIREQISHEPLIAS